MTENAFTPNRTSAPDDAATTATSPDDVAARATWAINSLLEAGEDALVGDLAATYDSELRLARAS